MTKQSDILGNDTYRPVLDHGFVGLIDTMGDDAAIVQAARVSYGAGTKTVNEDRGLIRYLIRNDHWTPVEMCEVKLHLKMPIFVARQVVRHRSASINEYSGRYSVMSDECYLPYDSALQPQSKTNKQGRSGELSVKEKEGIQWLMTSTFEHAYANYQTLVKSADEQIEGAEDSDQAMRILRDVQYDVYDPETGWLDESYPGLTRELSRIVLPVANYTEMYFKIDLRNLMNFLRLRMDHHAQMEVRVLAEAIYELVKPRFPLAIEAFDDYVIGGLSLSRMERELLDELLSMPLKAATALSGMIADHGDEKSFAMSRGMSVREFRDFREAWRL